MRHSESVARRLWMEEQTRLPGRTVVDQLERTNALGLAPVLEEDQSSRGEWALALRQRGLLDFQLHRALQFEWHMDNHRQGTVALAVSADAGLGFRLCLFGRRPFG